MLSSVDRKNNSSKKPNTISYKKKTLNVEYTKIINKNHFNPHHHGKIPIIKNNNWNNDTV